MSFIIIFDELVFLSGHCTNALKAKSCCELIFLVCPCAQKGSQQSLEEDAGSLDRTQKAVRQAMQDVHDMPVEESVRDFYFRIQ